jgi:hypothetical protein
MHKLIFFILLSTSFAANAMEWNFDVYLDKTKIGTHIFTLSEDGKMLSRAQFKVKILFLEAYSYDHISKEEWNNDCLRRIDANTIENKVVTKVSGSQEASLFNISNGEETQSLPGCVMTFAYWNPKTLKQSKLLNPQNAEYLPTNITEVGDELIEVKGNKIEAKRYKLLALADGKSPLEMRENGAKIKLDIDLWYDQNNNWVALQSTTPEGYKILYKLK